MNMSMLSGLLSKIGTGVKAGAGAIKTGASTGGKSIGNALKGIGEGAKTPTEATTTSGKIGAMLRYMLDDESRSTVSKKQMGGDNISESISGLPINKISKKVGDYTVQYGKDDEDNAPNLSSLLNKGNESDTKENSIIKFLKNMLGKSGADSTGSQEKVAVLSPDGTPGDIPIAQLQQALKMGYSLKK